MPEAILRIWVIYENPSDYPGQFVVREQFVGQGNVLMRSMPTAVVDSLEQARAVVPPDLYRQPRMQEDDPTIVETWF